MKFEIRSPKSGFSGALVHIRINTVTYVPCTKLLRPDSNNLQENIHHGDTEYTETVKFFVCRETTANENRQSCLWQEQGALFLSEGILFLPVVVSRRAKNCYPPCPPCLCGEHVVIKDTLPKLCLGALSVAKVRAFQRIVYDHYRAHGRDLPWRKTEDPYEILVSEVMLQQTQVPRVVEKYGQFLRAFPDIKSLARAPLREILNVWQGLGYNRRALALKKTAEQLVSHFSGRIPSKADSLTTLPGIGNATACAICAFAFNQPTVFVETNIRTVFIHHFFDGRNGIRDAHILPLVAQTLDHENPRTWYYALMDYGAAVKKRHGNPNTKSAHYKRQGRFEGSNRQIRGAILHALVREERISEHRLLENSGFSEESVRGNLEQLQAEGIIVKKDDYFSIP
jgi:A/G-specific adenine glycosylase